MPRTLIAIALALLSCFAFAQPQGMSRAYMCQKGDGPVVLVKQSELPDVRDSLCRAIEYREASWSEMRRCNFHQGGAMFTDAKAFRVEAGCRAMEEPLR